MSRSVPRGVLLPSPWGDDALLRGRGGRWDGPDGALLRDLGRGGGGAAGRQDRGGAGDRGGDGRSRGGAEEEEEEEGGAPNR